MRPPIRSRKRKQNTKQIKLKELKGIVVLKKARHAYSASDLVDYKNDLERMMICEVPDERDILDILKKLHCIQVSSQMVEESEIIGTLHDLLFFKSENVSEAATNILRSWQDGKYKHPAVKELARVPIEFKSPTAKFIGKYKD